MIENYLYAGEASNRRNPSGSLNQSDHGVCGVKNAQNACTPKFQVSEARTDPCHSEEAQLAENAGPALDQSG